MRLAALTLALLGLLLVGSKFAVAQERPANVVPAANVTTVADHAVVTPVRWHVYGPAPGWGVYRYRPYYPYRPRYYWYGTPGYHQYYYPGPYLGPGYYYPNSFGFEYRGPRRSFSFGF